MAAEGTRTTGLKNVFDSWNPREHRFGVLLFDTQHSCQLTGHVRPGLNSTDWAEPLGVYTSRLQKKTHPFAELCRFGLSALRLNGHVSLDIYIYICPFFSRGYKSQMEVFLERQQAEHRRFEGSLRNTHLSDLVICLPQGHRGSIVSMCLHFCP